MAHSLWDILSNSTAIAPNICLDFLSHSCGNTKDTCPEVHTKFPFLWQIELKGKWHNLPEFHNKELELEFRVPESDGVQLSAVDPSNNEQHFGRDKSWYADFDKMTIDSNDQRQRMRRLSTESSAVNQSFYSTDYEWFFRDGRGQWILYGQAPRRPNRKNKNCPAAWRTLATSDNIEREFSVNGLKAMTARFGRSAYDLDFTKMVQTIHTSIASRPMRRRPKAGTLTPGSGPADDYTSSPMLGTSPKRYKWQFMDEHKKWIDYGQVSSGNDYACVVTTTSADIEKEFAKNLKSVIQIQSHSHQYRLDFSSMKQTNLQTQVSRDVRRIVEKPSRTSSALSLINQEESDDEFPSNEYEWFFCDENNQWIKYGQISSGNDTNCVPFQGSDDIEKHYKTKPDLVMTIKSRQQTYELNLATLTQTNVRTKVQRPMRRVAKNSGSTNGGVAVSMQEAYEWYFKEDDGSWVKFGYRGNSSNIGNLERHYLSKPSTNFKFTAGKQSYVLNFTNMTQTNTSTGQVREVRRRKQLVSTTGGAFGSSSTLASTKLFTEIPIGQTSYATPLGANHAEYAKVLSLLKSTNCQPRNIFKVNNPYLKAAFEIKMAQLQSQYPSVPYREECLFHGTKPANVKAIMEENIDWRLHGSNAGQNQGRGAYFSNNARFSRGYGEVIFICKVLVGLTAPGNAQTVKPPKDGSNLPIDTTVDHKANPTIFVKYDSQEYYSEYLAQF